MNTLFVRLLTRSMHVATIRKSRIRILFTLRGHVSFCKPGNKTTFSKNTVGDESTGNISRRVGMCNNVILYGMMSSR